MAEIKLTGLDFEQQKEELREFLKNRPEFQDYDFDGSSISYLLDILSYYSTMNTYYLHMVSNEMFLDSAQDRNNVVSRAKALGYIPNSRRSAIAYLDIELIPNGNPVSIFIPENTRFLSKIDNRSFYFHTQQAYTVYPVAGKYKQTLELHQGIRLVHKFVIDNEKHFPNSVFEIPNANIDTNLLQVKIQKSAAEAIIETYKEYSDLDELKSDSRIYFLQEGIRNKFEIIFGDDILGKKLKQGNVVIIDYVVSEGESANACNSFSPTTFTSEISSFKISNIIPAAGGTNNETIENIKKLAPLAYQAQNRMVTKTDFETIIQKDFPGIESIRVWGGEENKPFPEYGKVFVAIKPLPGLSISDNLKNRLITQVIKPKNLVNIDVEIQEPFYIFLDMDIELNYDSRTTNDTEQTISNVFKNSILNYSTNSLSRFERSFELSKFINAISNSHNSIANVVVNYKLQYQLIVNTIFSQEYRIDFANALNPVIDSIGRTCLSSSGFIFNGFNAYMKDDGKGNILIYRIVEGKHVVITEKVGEIDYQNGMVFLKKFYTSQILSGDDFLEITVNPLRQNINSFRNQILLIDEQYLTIHNNDISIR